MVVEQRCNGVCGINNNSACCIEDQIANNNCPNNYSSCASPNRFIQTDAFHLSGRLSTVPPERYEETIGCCLPPPSPAPTNDRYVIGIPSPSPSATSSIVGGGSNGHHHYASQQDNPHSRYSQGMHASHHSSNRTMSPSSRYRSSMSERYRDISPKCDRFVGASHFLANSTPMASNDTYAYLTSTVHTPVKRYVPTPPPSNDNYSEITSSSSNAGNVSNGNIYHHHMSNPHLAVQQQQQQSCGNVNGPQQQQQQQQQRAQATMTSGTMPYRFRMKCCPNDQASQCSGPLMSGDLSVADHYATPPRVRPIKCSSQQQQQQQSQSSNVAVNGRPSPRTLSCTSNGGSSEYMQRTPSVEYIGPAGGRVVTPVSVMSEPGSVGACHHCNTMRRTTGVHQTTQTTGPISPVPQQPLSITPSSNSSLSDKGKSNSILSADHIDMGHHSASTSPPSPLPSSSKSLPSIAHQPPLSPITQSAPGSNHQHHNGHQSLQDSPPSSLRHNQAVSASVNNMTLSLQRQNLSASCNNGIPQSASATTSSGMSAQYRLHQHHAAQLQLQQQASSPPQLPQLQPPQLLQPQSQPMLLHHQQRMSRKQRVKEYIRREVAKFFGVDVGSEEHERHKWAERQKRLAIRRFGPLKDDVDIANSHNHHVRREQQGDRPDILPPAAQTTDDVDGRRGGRRRYYLPDDMRRHLGGITAIERKRSVPKMMWNGMAYVVQTLSKKRFRRQRQWSRSFAPEHVILGDDGVDDGLCDGLSPLQDDEVFFESTNGQGNGGQNGGMGQGGRAAAINGGAETTRQIYVGERIHGWRTRGNEPAAIPQQLPLPLGAVLLDRGQGYRGTRITPQLLDGVLDNSRRPLPHTVKLLRPNELDDRHDYRPFFTYWINTVQILVLIISLICYGIGPIGIGVEHKSGQVLVTSLSLQQVQHQEQRNVWIGLRNDDLVHLGAKFASCMRRDHKVIDVIAKTRRQERETACCIRNDDSGCVQSSQADCSVRGLWPTKSISTWKKWSPGDSGPGGRISGSVCGLDPKYCDAPASVAPYEWPDDITKWPICRKTNSFSQRSRFKDHTAEHMVCEVIGHPCCTGVHGECRITTREYCDFVNGYFHEEASLCSQVSCLNDVCGMLPFLTQDYPDQFYRLFTSLCLHAGIIHLAITVAFQHIFLADLERLIGPIRTAIVYIGSGIAGNLTSSIFVPYKTEVGPLASLAGVLSSLSVLLTLIHWRQLKKPHFALIKLLIIIGTLFGLGTLPWQQNFTGLLAGLVFGTALTLAVVPFVSITKYERKSKVNLIWTCMILHLTIYIGMFIIFYIFPSTFTSFGIGNSGNFGQHNTNIIHTNINGGIIGGNNIITNNNNNNNNGIGSGSIGSNNINGGITTATNHFNNLYNIGGGGGIIGGNNDNNIPGHVVGGGNGGGPGGSGSGHHILSNNLNRNINININNNNGDSSIISCEKGQCSSTSAIIKLNNNNNLISNINNNISYNNNNNLIDINNNNNNNDDIKLKKKLNA